MYTSNGVYSTGCGVITLLGVSSQSPRDTLLEFLKQHPPTIQRFDVETKKYVTASSTGYIHVIFGGPDMSTLPPKKGHYSSVGSCGAFAAFIREHALGSVVKSPPRHNPYHNERKPGEGDVIVYIWSPNQAKLAAWAKANPLVGPPTIG